MKILSCETSLGKVSVCYFNTVTDELNYLEDENFSTQAENLFQLIEKSINNDLKNLDNIDYFSSSIGPGSFTGIRIGMTALQSLAYAKNKKFIGITTLEALAHKAFASFNSDNITALINAKRGELYFQHFNRNNFFSPQTAGTIKNSEVANLQTSQNNNPTLASNCFELLTEKNDISALDIINQSLHPNADDIARLTYKIIEQGISLENRTNPIYIRKPDAKKSEKLKKFN